MSLLIATLILGQSAPKPTIHQESTIRASYTMTAAWPEFPESHPLAEILNKNAASPVRAAQQSFKDALAGLTEEPAHPWNLDITTVVSYNSAKLVSILYNKNEYAGGAHANATTHVLNAGIVDGKPKLITLTDIATPGSGPRILEMVRYRLSSFRFDRVNEEVGELPPETSSKFLVGKNALTFLFDPYTIGSYAEGAYTVKLGYGELAGLLRSDLIAEAKP